MKFRLLIWISFLFLIFSVVNINTNAEEVVETQPALCNGGTAAILYEGNTNKILFNKDMNRRLAPASMTKIMTLVLIYEALETNQITKDKIITIGELATKVEGSKAFLSIGEQISVDELLKCICIASANDAAITMAIEISGSEEEFVKKMNQKVKELDLKNTNFSDCTGLSSKNHYTSAYDLAVISDYLLEKYPDVLNYTNIKEDYIRKDSAKPFWLVNTNKMIGRVKDLDGLKTGYTSFSKYCITLHMNQNNMSLISVVFGYDNATTRNAESLALLRYGSANYKVEKILEKNKVIESIIHILYKDRIDLKIKEDVYYLSKKSDNCEFNYNYVFDLNNNKSEIKLYLNNENIYISEMIIDMSCKKNFFELMLSIIKEVFL